MPLWAGGYAQTLGDILVTGKPLFTSFTTYFVLSTSGSDSNDGLDPSTPFATYGAANTALSGQPGIIVLLSGHTEVLTATITPAAGQIIVGAGASGGKPTVKLQLNAAATIMVTASNAGVQLRNIWFQDNAQNNTAAKVKFTGINGLVSGCYFECGPHDTSAANVEFGTGGSGGRVENCTFVSTATVATTKPFSGVVVSAALTDISVSNTVFDGGTYGFSSYALSANSAPTRSRFENFSLLRGADAIFGATTGFVLPTTVTGGSRISYSGGT